MILNSVPRKRTLRPSRVGWFATRFGQIDDSTRSILIDTFQHQHHDQVRRFVAFPLGLVVAIPVTSYGTRPHIHALLTWPQIFSVMFWWDILHVHVLRPRESQKLAAWLKRFIRIRYTTTRAKFGSAQYLIGKFGMTLLSPWDQLLSFLITDGIS